MNQELIDQLTQSLSGLNFASPGLITGDPTAFLEGLTVGQFRTLINQTKNLLQSQDFSTLSFLLNDPNLSGNLDGPTRKLIQDLIDGDFSFFTAAFDVALEAVAGFAASAALLTALTSDTGGGGTGGGVTPTVKTFLDEVAELFRGSSDPDDITARAEIGRILGGGGDDTIRGSTVVDDIRGGGGDDVLRGRGGDDELRGNGGSDKVIGGGGNDDIRTGGGADNGKGGGGDDMLKGQGGADRLNGGGGTDTLEGGRADDTLKGGGGVDHFMYKPGAGNDVILDFGGGDQIVISRGADEFSDLSIQQQGNDVLIEFANVDILIKTDDVNNFDASDFMFT